MKVALRARTVYQKVTLAATAFVLAVASLTASVPFILSQNASAASSVVYEGIPNPGSAAYASLGYEATSTNEFGDLVQLSGSNRLLSDVTVNFTSWACQTGSWSTNDCVSADGATFTHPVTVNVYKAGSGNTLGALLATKTQTITAKYRPSSDATHCTGADAGKWYDTASATCYNGISFNQSFDLSGLNKVVPDQIVVGVAFNTKDHGYAPTSVASPADSLNVSLPTSGPTTGTDVDSNSVFWSTSYSPNYTDGGAAGNGFRADSNWSPYHVGINVSANPVPTTSTCSTIPTQWSTNLTAWNSTPGLDDTRSAGHNAITGDGIHVYTDDATSNAKATGYLPVNYPLSGNGSQTIAQSMEWTQNSGTVAPGLQLVVDFNNDGVYDGILVGESVYGNNWWLTNGSQSFVKDAAPHTGGGNGSNWFGTINDWLTAFPAAQVKYVGYSLGSGVHADGLIKSMTFGCTQYRFDGVAPATPVLTTPGNNTYSTTNDFYFKWNAVSDASHYEIQYSTNPAVNGDGSFQNVQWTGDYQHIQPTAPQARSVGASGTWYWQVRSVDAAGNTSVWTTPWKVTIDTVAPDAPTLNSPANGAVVPGATLTQSWNASVSSDVDHYIYESYNNASATSLRWHELFSSSTLSKTATNVANSTFWWRVKAVDTAGNVSAWSPLWKVTVDNNMPTVPTNLSWTTSDGTSIANGGLTHLYGGIASWQASTGSVDHYVYKYWNNIPGNAYNSEANAWTTTTTSTSLPGVFNQGEGTHYFSIEAVNAAGHSLGFSGPFQVTYSTEVTLTVDPVNNSTNTPSVTGTAFYTADNAPLANTPLTVTVDGQDYSTQTDGTGTWGITTATLAPNTYTAVVKDGAGHQASSDPFTIAADTSSTGTTDPTNGQTPNTTPAAVTVVTTPTANTNGGLPFATFGTPQVLGDSTSNSSTDPTGASDVKGTSTQKNTLAAAIPDSSNGSVFGLAWYWWLLILAAIATVIWWIISAIRNRAATN